MDLICHCVSTNCSNCPRYRNWLEGKDPGATPLVASTLLSIKHVGAPKRKKRKK